ncbi:MAG: LytTR family transcriptional regulator DNA-binding domain-containing protein [Lachnospiraceae bacterium]|nr:LytTR family transcriptional regulator DNA-binding domain-containing protein [Lachnospiraceae bacterium]
MKVILEKVAKPEEEGAHIRAVELTEEVRNAVDLLENNCRSISVSRVGEEKSPGESYMLGTNRIYYTESIDKRTYVYTKEECFETRYRLYELEDILGVNFLRVSKSLVVNMRKIRSVKTELNGRMTAELLNGEKIVISRSYVKDLKRKLGV